jgi:hypothetical protein
MSDEQATPVGSPAPDAGPADDTPAGATRSLPPFIGTAAAEVAAELPRKAVDAVQLLVDTIHDKAVRPTILATRAVVFGLLVATLVATLVVVGSIAVVRLFDVYVFGHQVWLSYIVLGGALSFAGLAVWSRRTARSSAARAH